MSKLMFWWLALATLLLHDHSVLECGSSPKVWMNNELPFSSSGSSFGPVPHHFKKQREFQRTLSLISSRFFFFSPDHEILKADIFLCPLPKKVSFGCNNNNKEEDRRINKYIYIFFCRFFQIFSIYLKKNVQ